LKILSVTRTFACAVGTVSLLSFALPEAQAKTPGHIYCFNKICHRVKTIGETVAAVGQTTDVTASYYDDARHDRLNPSNATSSGEHFQADRADNAASPVYPDGTKLLVWNPGTKRSAVVRVNNAGPYHGKRLLDVSRTAADALGFRKQGVARLRVRVLEAPTEREARYQRGRKYAPVPGFLGIFGSIEMALTDATKALAGLVVSPAAAATAPANPGYVRVASAGNGRKMAKLHKRGWKKSKLASARKAKRKVRWANHQTNRKMSGPARLSSSKARMSLGKPRSRL
jgi:rare lipoprotein A